MTTPRELIVFKARIVQTRNYKMRDLNLLHVRRVEGMSYNKLADLFCLDPNDVKRIVKGIAVLR